MFNRSAYEFDYVLVGGGLQAALLALAIRDARPAASVAIVERGAQLGGDHLWSFHAGDLPPGAERWIEPLVVRRWPRWRVRFAELDRGFERPYATVRSTRLHEVVSAAMRDGAASGCALFLGVEARQVGARAVTLEGGRVLRGKAVIDARGPSQAALRGRIAYQKFVGLELALDRPLSTEEAETATVFDATVEQRDGFRFFYTLPFAPDRVLIEETFYSERASLDVASLRTSIVAYALARGLRVREVVREERGVLPLPIERLGDDHAAADGARDGAIQAGYAGGFFHPTTGYSLPIAARVAARIAGCAPELAAIAAADVRAEIAPAARYCLLLNRLLFGAIAPEDRRNVLERFHTLPEETVLRFYALTPTAADRARILCGHPPRGMSIRRALATLTSSAEGAR